MESKLLNAADYGVPQRRSRLFFVGTKKAKYSWPQPTHGLSTKKPHLNVYDAISDLPSLESGQEAFTYDKQPLTAFQRSMRKNAGNILTNHRAPNHPLATIKKIASTKPGQSMYPKFKQRIRLSWELPSPTQVSGGIRPPFQFGHPQDARGLTIRERCRIQSFPDDFVVAGGIVQSRVQTGNAVPPLLAKAVATNLLGAL